MQILRHGQIAVTMQVYSEVPSEATKDALKRLGQSLDWPTATATAVCCIGCCTKITKGRPRSATGL
jgi:hypothetical protein